MRLTSYAGDASDLPADVLQGFLDDVAAGSVTVPLARVYDLDGVVEAHRLMEHGSAGGKLVVVYVAIVSPDPTGTGQWRWSMRWKPALNAFDTAFDGRLSAGRR